MIGVYTAGYMTGPDSDRMDWRRKLHQAVYRQSTDKKIIQWLDPAVPKGAVPGQGDPRFYSPRDILQVKSCDVLIAFFDVDTAIGYGATIEMGMAYAWQKRIIMIDFSPDCHSLDFNRKISDSVWTTIDEAARALYFVAQGFE